MSSQSAEQTTSPYRMPLAIGIVVLSIVLPVAVICWAAGAELRDKGIAVMPSKVARNYIGSVNKGELWHAELYLSSNPSGPPVKSRVMRLNLETGVECETGLAVHGEFGRPLWFGGELYFQTDTAIFQRLESEFVKIAALPISTSTFHASVFLWEGRLTTIRRNTTGSCRLVHLSNGNWIEGRPVLLPQPGSVWYDDMQRGRLVLLPRTSQPPTSMATPGASLVVIVQQHGSQHHVMIWDGDQFSAYRTGFEFADEPLETTSALAPENAAQDVSGWEMIGPTKAYSTCRWIQMNRCRDGLLFFSWIGKRHIVRRNNDGTWEELARQQRPNLELDWVVSDPDDTAAYVIGTDQQWGSAEVSRIEGNIVRPTHLVIPGVEREYLARWQRIGTSLVFAWWLHVVLLIGGAAWLSREVTSIEFEFGTQRATLAPFLHHSIATGVDVSLLLISVGGLWKWTLQFVETEPPALVERTLAGFLLGMEQELTRCLTGNFGPVLMNITNYIPQLLWLFGISIAVTGVIVAGLVVIGGAKVCLEGRCGITPGKWLLGLRTVRTTLRPCGIARAIVRNVFYCFDIPLLLTPLPAAISLMFSDHRQRLGDRVADTIVVRAGSMREVS
ncbi:MAG: RDD family protein [Planctomycetales bacterium]|nr:RDD family protein [Planctomycetales bacterium]